MKLNRCLTTVLNWGIEPSKTNCNIINEQRRLNVVGAFHINFLHVPHGQIFWHAENNDEALSDNNEQSFPWPKGQKVDALSDFYNQRNKTIMAYLLTYRKQLQTYLYLVHHISCTAPHPKTKVKHTYKMLSGRCLQKNQLEPIRMSANMQLNQHILA